MQELSPYLEMANNMMMLVCCFISVKMVVHNGFTAIIFMGGTREMGLRAL